MSDHSEQEIDVNEQLKSIPEAKMKEVIYRDIEDIHITGFSSLGVPESIWTEDNHQRIEEGVRTIVQEIEAEAHTWEWAAQIEDLEDDIIEIFNPNDPHEQAVISAWVWMIAKGEAEGSDLAERDDEGRDTPHFE